MEKEKRQNQVHLRLSDDELTILNEKYRQSGFKTLNAYIIHLIKYSFSYDVDYSELHQYNIELGRIAKSLNQIATRANASGSVYREDIQNMQEMMKQVWQLQESMLSKQPYRKQ